MGNVDNCYKEKRIEQQNVNWSIWEIWTWMWWIDAYAQKNRKKKQEIPERNLIDKGEKEQADFGDNCTAKTMPAHQGKTETRQWNNANLYKRGSRKDTQFKPPNWRRSRIGNPVKALWSEKRMGTARTNGDEKSGCTPSHVSRVTFGVREVKIE